MCVCVYGMALLKYLRPVGNTIDAQGTLSSIVPRAVIEEVNNELKGTRQTPKRRSSYSSFSSEQKAQVASTNGVRPAMKHFNKVFGKELKENTVRDWVKLYKRELQKKRSSTEVGDDMEVMELPSKKRGRPFLLERRSIQKSRLSSRLCVTMEQWLIEQLL